MFGCYRWTLVVVLLGLQPVGLRAQDSTRVWVESIGSPQYFAVLVADIDRSVEWYRTAFGLTDTGGSRADDGSWEIVNLASPDLSVELIRDDRAQPVDRARGFLKVGLRVPDVRRVADAVGRATGERPRVLEFAEFGVRIIQIHDPDGNTIQLASPLEAQSPAPPPGAAVGEHQIVVDGVRLWYRVAGSGADGVPPVVFLHGGPGQGSHHFEALVGPAMEASLRMVYLDQRGSGRSERPWTRAYSIPRLVQDIEGLRAALGAPELVLLAHSFGSVLALEYAATYPDRVAGLVIVAGLWDMAVQCPLRLEVLAERAPDAYARVRSDTLRSDGSRRSDCELEFDAFQSGAEREAFNNAIMFPDSITRVRLDSVTAASGLRNTGEIGAALFRSGLLEYGFTGFSSVRAPALVIAGGRDGAAVPEGLEILASRLPNARFLEFESSGHFVYLDEPDRFVREVTRFVREAAGEEGGR